MKIMEKMSQLARGVTLISLILFSVIGDKVHGGQESAQANLNEIDAIKNILNSAEAQRYTNPEHSLKLAEDALTLYENNLNSKMRARFLNILAWSHLRLGNFKHSETYIESVINLAENSHNIEALADAYNTKGGFYWYKLDNTNAYRYYEKSLALYREIGDSRKIATLLSNLGTIQQYKEDYTSAMTLFIKSQKYAILADDKEQLAATLDNIGVLYQSTGQQTKALDVYNQSLKIKLNLGNNTEIANTYLNIATVHGSTNNYELALEHLRNAAGFIKSIKAPMLEMYIHLNFGEVYLKLEQFEYAIEHLSISKKIAEQRDDPHILRMIFSTLTHTYIKKNKPHIALEYAEKTLDTAIKFDLENLDSAYYDIYSVQKSLGDYTNALTNFENYNQLKNRRLEQDKLESMNRLREEYESEIKSEKIISLKNTNSLQLRIFIAVILFAIIIFMFLHRFRSMKLKTTFLESKVAERTKEIEDQNKVISNLLIKKNELFSNVSHEFRTPLTLIMSPLKDLLKSQKNPHLKTVLKMSIYNSEKLLRMVDQMLDLAKLDTHKEKEIRSIDISQSIKFALIYMSPLFKENNLTIDTLIEDELWVKITQENADKIFGNLISNAIKYTPKSGNIRITASKTSINSNNHMILASISDSGIGVPSNEKDRIFERFVRLESNSKLSTPGAGVGLALVKELIELCDGKIYLDEEYTTGAKFILEFPAAEATSSQSFQGNSDFWHTESEVARNYLPNELEVNSRNINVHSEYPKLLIVEDNPDMSTYISTCLDGHFESLYAHDGDEGVKIALEEIPDIIITDLMMPNKSGFEMSEILRNDKLTCHIPIVMLTAKEDETSRIHAWELDIDEYIEKPFNRDELIIRCHNLLNIRKLISERIRNNDSRSLRTKNNQTQNPQISQADNIFMKELNQCMNKNFEGRLDASILSAELKINSKQLQRKIKALYNQTIPELIRNYRLTKGADLLRSGKDVTTIALSVGFSSQNYFSKCFSARYGMSPSSYKSIKQ